MKANYIKLIISSVSEEVLKSSISNIIASLPTNNQEKIIDAIIEDNIVTQKTIDSINREKLEEYFLKTMISFCGDYQLQVPNQIDNVGEVYIDMNYVITELAYAEAETDMTEINRFIENAKGKKISNDEFSKMKDEFDDLYKKHNLKVCNGSGMKQVKRLAFKRNGFSITMKELKDNLIIL